PRDLNDPATGRSATSVTQGNTTMGVTETQVPLMKLPYLDVPETPNLDAGADVVALNKDKVHGFFYDDLCCAKGGHHCGAPDLIGCCPGFRGIPIVDGVGGLCFERCKAENEKCQTASDCCLPDGGGTPFVCGRFHTCVQCSQTNQQCTSDADCCSGL